MQGEAGVTSMTYSGPAPEPPDSPRVALGVLTSLSGAQASGPRSPPDLAPAPAVEVRKASVTQAKGELNRDLNPEYGTREREAQPQQEVFWLDTRRHWRGC